ncbi:replication factor A protein [Trifolium repens]|nr:replication factor A protein [Trifolium repens]
MAPKHDSISDISPAKENWNLIVRVVRLWYVKNTVKDKLPFSNEMVLMDSKGDRIHATVRRTLIYKFNKELKEDSVFAISNFGVVSNIGSYRTTKHLYKLNFQFSTRIKLSGSRYVPQNLYLINHPAEIFSGRYDTNYLVDLMGMLTAVDVEKTYQRNGAQSKNVVIELDHDGYRFKCTLFGAYVDMLNAFLASGKTDNVVVVILLAKVKILQGRAIIQNTIYSTKLLFNPVYSAAVDLKKKMVENNDTPSHFSNRLQDNSNVSLIEDFMQDSLYATIEGLKKSRDEGVFVVSATVKLIVDDNDWWYTACVCNNKVYPDERMYFCEKCNKHVLNVSPKYRIKVRVIDSTDSAIFVIFDRDGVELFNMACAEMIHSVGLDENSSRIPKPILDLVDKTYLFKVETNISEETRYEKSYRVNRITANAEVVAMFNAKYSIYEVNNAGDEVSNGNVVDVDAKENDSTADLFAQNLMEKYDDHGGYKGSNTIDLTADTDDVDDGRYKGSNTIDLTADTDDVETNKRDFSFVGATTFDASTSEPMLKQVKIEKD